MVKFRNSDPFLAVIKFYILSWCIKCIKLHLIGKVSLVTINTETATQIRNTVVLISASKTWTYWAFLLTPVVLGDLLLYSALSEIRTNPSVLCFYFNCCLTSPFQGQKRSDQILKKVSSKVTLTDPTVTQKAGIM